MTAIKSAIGRQLLCEALERIAFMGSREQILRFATDSPVLTILTEEEKGNEARDLMAGRRLRRIG